MTLVNRVSAFFLAALALALIGYSAVFYFLVRDYLYRQFDDDLHNALQLLAASVEVEPDDAKWHPAEHGIDLADEILNKVVWVVCDERGQAIDRSPRAKRTDPTYQQILAYAREHHVAAEKPVELDQWRVLQRKLVAPAPKPVTEREPHEYAGLEITVARSHEELNLAMERLALIVIVLPATVWIIAAAMGRGFVRRALSPVRNMADRARSMTNADFDLRLPVGGSRDELSELGAAFNNLLGQLQAAFDRQRRFTGDAAHQLRTPLAVLQGQLDVALRRTRPVEEYQQTLGVLAEQTAELRQIVESLLFLARSEGDAFPPNCQAIALDEWLRQYVTRWDDHPRRSDLTVEVTSPAIVSASGPLLSQLLDNLVSNSLKYSEPGTPVTIGAAREHDRVRLSVEDRGVGIGAKEQQAIFEPFYRSDVARRGGIAGTGLGLSVAARIAVALGGELRCESSPGNGSTFTLVLPAVGNAKPLNVTSDAPRSV